LARLRELVVFAVVATLSLVILVTMTTMSLGEVKAHLSEDLEQLEETLEILSDQPTLLRLAESDAELARGAVVSAEDLAETMQRRRSAA
jgi:hypothetical protein